MTEPPRQGEFLPPTRSASAQPVAPARKETLWVLERADSLIGEIALTVWLSVASIWRVPHAAIARNSMVQLEALVASRKILPPRMSLLVASIASALFLAWILPERTLHQTAHDTVGRLASVSPENWLAVAAPALVSLWMTAIAFASLLSRAAGVGAPEPHTTLMQTTSSMATLSCLGALSVLHGEYWLRPLRPGLDDLLALSGFWLMILYLGLAGWTCARQMCVASGCANWRRRAMLVLGPLGFISSALVALVATYWLVQAQALVADTMNRGEPPGYPQARSPSCFASDDAMVCQALLTARTDLAIGALQRIDIEWRDLTRSGQFKKFLPVSQVAQLNPRVELGGFWTLRAKEPMPLAFRIAKGDACRLRTEVAAFRQRVMPTEEGQRPRLELLFTIQWRPGYGLVKRDDAALANPRVRFELAGPDLETAMGDLCSDGN